MVWKIEISDFFGTEVCLLILRLRVHTLHFKAKQAPLTSSVSRFLLFILILFNAENKVSLKYVDEKIVSKAITPSCLHGMMLNYLCTEITIFYPLYLFSILQHIIMQRHRKWGMLTYEVLFHKMDHGRSLQLLNVVWCVVLFLFSTAPEDLMGKLLNFFPSHLLKNVRHIKISYDTKCELRFISLWTVVSLMEQQRTVQDSDKWLEAGLWIGNWVYWTLKTRLQLITALSIQFTTAKSIASSPVAARNCFQ
jgi:hypothetical protein